ncbi:hypothetical protein KCH_14800 [Kitasatospora cheerisanensis KCTC 2395]|uniref:Leucine rich repeat variant n=1 Tax=Kitasatospora cheerisanensis KCTC 2395 TaxID=1348663 RepID=A0A066Z8V3_9ACTN|nr:hypothetical protein KCH_14800 [Kitasatospora cheerisanensis KCTC 2395]
MRHVWAGLAANPALPSEAVDRLLALAEPDLSTELAERADLTDRQVTALAERDLVAAGTLAEAGRLTAAQVNPLRQPLAALALLRAGLAPVQWADVLLERPELHAELAGCPVLPPEVSRRLAAAPDLAVATELAEATTDPAIAALLAAHPSAHVRAALGSNEHTPAAVLSDLINDLPPLESCEVCERHPVPWVHPPDCPDPDCTLHPGAACDGSHQFARESVLQATLQHPAAPAADVLTHLDAEAPNLRAQLAGRTDLPASAYATLAADPQIWVREPLASNPAIGEHLLRRLAADPSEDVRRSAAQHPRIPLDVLDRVCTTVRLGPLPPPRIAAATPAELDALAGSANRELRRLTALRRDLPAPVRDRLADDPDPRVAAAIAPHPGLDERQLRTMRKRHGRAVGAGIAANPGAPTALLAELVRTEHNVATLRALATHPAADGPTLVACLRDPAPAAGPPPTPPSPSPTSAPAHRPRPHHRPQRRRQPRPPPGRPAAPPPTAHHGLRTGEQPRYTTADLTAGLLRAQVEWLLPTAEGRESQARSARCCTWRLEGAQRTCSVRVRRRQACQLSRQYRVSRGGEMSRAADTRSRQPELDQAHGSPRPEAFHRREPGRSPRRPRAGQRPCAGHLFTGPAIAQGAPRARAVQRRPDRRARRCLGMEPTQRLRPGDLAALGRAGRRGRACARQRRRPPGPEAGPGPPARAWPPAARAVDRSARDLPPAARSHRRATGRHRTPGRSAPRRSTDHRAAGRPPDVRRGTHRCRTGSPGRLSAHDPGRGSAARRAGVAVHAGGPRGELGHQLGLGSARAAR